MQKHSLDNGIKKIALLGNTGVGKGTFADIVEDIVKHKVYRMKLAKPLYDAQESIYNLCDVSKEYGVQDGELLNFLGVYMRKINPQVLEESLRKRLKHISEGVVICDDARPTDVKYLKDLNFIIVEIIANTEIAMKRRTLRGDLSLANPHHESEQGRSAVRSDFKVVNESTIEDFRDQISKIVEVIL
jgi:dephospho-CoA kinase